MLLIVLGIGILVFLLLPLYSGAPQATKRAACQNNLHQIALALRGYHDTYKCFPPAYLADKNGKPMHSWRVLILPYMGERNLYDQYRLDEPWDSPNNRRISDLAVGLYQCPSQPDSKDPTTNYMMVVGPRTVSDGSHGRKIADITDGLHDTIMLVEVADSGTWWAEPRDLSFDQVNFKINSSKRQGISSYHLGGINAAFCDGSVRFLNDSIPPQLLKAMLTIDGGEQVPAEP
jgi:prepilin-type processing-associated H-X9-DG protein